MGTEEKLEIGLAQLNRRVSQFKKKQTPSNFNFLIQGIESFEKLIKVLALEEDNIYKYLKEFKSKIETNFVDFENKKRKNVITRFEEDRLTWIKDRIKQL